MPQTSGDVPHLHRHGPLAAVCKGFTAGGCPPETADAWIEAWEVKAAGDGLERGSAFWQSGWDWIAERRQHRVRP